MAGRWRERAAALLKLEARMTRAYADRLAARRARLTATAQLLAAVGYREVLARGFALVRDAADRPLRRAAEVRPAQPLRVEFADGIVTATASGRATTREAPPPDAVPIAPKRRRRERDAEGQGSLF